MLTQEEINKEFEDTPANRAKFISMAQQHANWFRVDVFVVREHDGFLAWHPKSFCVGKLSDNQAVKEKQLACRKNPFVVIEEIYPKGEKLTSTQLVKILIDETLKSVGMIATWT